jgi:hypothetical protein
MTDIIERLRFDVARCEATYSKGIATNIEEAIGEIERLRAQLCSQPESAWQPIDTAPKDGTVILVAPSVWRGRNFDMARWEPNEYAEKPKPFWLRDSALQTQCRENTPTHWMPQPEFNITRKA